ncbi:GvpL/GvpF family gas vesicle protein [Streptomyces rhizosphaerihabitans]|uniref:GvpL/GvpF family gas vesicle protein n=1 Tax=Streptomyces rhizosphaerihabitans TaxID=1266770 RepID=UPI0021BE8E19|nr:GvpL/GvpF family gas vesicle protein [Streptomyces rhizosphaerihabitans]MCT9009218.1 GvpL/GvpF family gas vesicle protein [Streptomyces rhizosphaerihabitans]
MTERGPELSGVNAIYVFAVCRKPDLSAVVGLPGVTDQASVSSLSLGALTAIVQTVRASDFTDEVWQARLSDQRELERYARAHHDVVAAVAARCPTVPLPMATLYHGEERAREALAKEADRFDAALKRIAHHAEWGVKVFVPPCPQDETVPTPVRHVTPTERSRPAPGAGLAYLNRKRGAQERRERIQDEALRTAEAVDTEVRGLATASRRLRPHAQPSGEHRVQVLNATYLVSARRAEELAVLTRTLRERTGVDIELSGPWVPYSFVGEV